MLNLCQKHVVDHFQTEAAFLNARPTCSGGALQKRSWVAKRMFGNWLVRDVFSTTSLTRLLSQNKDNKGETKNVNVASCQSPQKIEPPPPSFCANQVGQDLKCQ